MDIKGLKQRPKDVPTTTTRTRTRTAIVDAKNRKAQKLAMSKRGLRLLVVAIAMLFILATLAACISGTVPIANISRPFWCPPTWAFHVTSITASYLMGLLVWLVWADGRFHYQPITLALFLAQFILGLAQGPLVFHLGAIRVGLIVCIILFAVLHACSRSFHRMNPIAGNLIKPYLT